MFFDLFQWYNIDQSAARLWAGIASTEFLALESALGTEKSFFSIAAFIDNLVNINFSFSNFLNHVLDTCSFVSTWFETALLKTTGVLFNPIQDEGEKDPKMTLDKLFPVTSTNVEPSLQNFLTFSVNPFGTLV